jgi:hypothetical protein
MAYQRSYVSCTTSSASARESVREIDQPTPLALDRARARIEPAVSWLGLGGHVSTTSLGHICFTSSTRHRTEL